MTQFKLNHPTPPHPFHSLDLFGRAYVEAMFFTNGDTGDEREHLLNEMGTERLSNAAVATIQADCDRFRAIVLPGPGGATVQRLLDVLQRERGYTIEQAGHDLWFTRQGHGVGFWSREELASFGDVLSDAASNLGESYVETDGEWIHVR